MNKQRDSHSKEVIEMMQMAKMDQNKNCVECGAPCPLWVSYTCGVFICTRCAGLHRSLGVHISRVKSITLDSWTPELVEIMRRRGNRISRRYFEGTLPEEYPRPKDERSLVEFIKNKYQYRTYVVSKQSFEDFVASENPKHSNNTAANVEKPLTPKDAGGSRKSSQLFERTEVTTPTAATVKNDLDDLFSEPMKPIQSTQPINPVGVGEPVLSDDLFSIPNTGNQTFQGMQFPQQQPQMTQNTFNQYQGQNMPVFSMPQPNFQGFNPGIQNQMPSQPMGSYPMQGQMQSNQQYFTPNQPQRFNSGFGQPQQGGNMPQFPFGNDPQQYFGGNPQMFPQPEPSLPIKKDIDPFAGLANFQPSQKDPFF